jgi:hypothetical protein
MMKIFALLVCLLVTKYLISAVEASPVEFGGFLDTYYAFDLGRPANQERSYTTTAARHNELNINLAHLEALISREKTQARLAFQAGTSVQNNYAGEPTRGSTSGGSLSRHLQEAWLEYELTPTTQVKGGIYFSHIGSESFISTNNFTYTRSLAADYSPYYQSGVALLHQFDGRHQAEFHLINGWQNISEDNEDKALGLKYTFRPGASDDLIFGYSNYLGSYQNRARIFQDFNLAWELNSWFSLMALFDYGIQETAARQKKNFHTANLQGKFSLSEFSSLSLRGEYYADPHQLNVVSVSSQPFRVHGGSITYDRHLEEGVLWRLEGRHLQSSNLVFVKKSGNSKNNTLFASSFSLQF